MDDEKYRKVLKYRINEVIHYIWDPIGVSDTPECRDEYGTYADTVWRDVLEGKSKSEISDYLTGITSEQMELSTRKDHDDKVADIILDWARFLKHPYGL